MELILKMKEDVLNNVNYAIKNFQCHLRNINVKGNLYI